VTGILPTAPLSACPRRGCRRPPECQRNCPAARPLCTGATTEDCRAALRESGGDAKVAVVMLIAHAGAERARHALAAAHRHVHLALSQLDGRG
jgi:hypothetical protein